jgi:hypothetical protein
MKIKYTRGKNSNHEDFYLQYNNEVKYIILFHKLTLLHLVDYFLQNRKYNDCKNMFISRHLTILKMHLFTSCLSQRRLISMDINVTDDRDHVVPNID